MTFNQMKAEYNERYNNECYGDSETKSMLNMFDAAEKMTDEAKCEFVRVFNFEFALDGELYLGGGKMSAIKEYSNLINEAKKVGITLIAGRGEIL